MATMYKSMINSPSTTLASSITASDTIIPLVDSSKLPSAPNIATIGTTANAETILYTGKDGNNLTGVTRGFQGTANSWDSGITVARYFTSYDHDTFVDNIGDLSTLSTTSKTSLTSAMNEVFQNVSNGKGLIATAITDKGVSTSSSDTFSTMATNITSIPTGGANDGTWKPLSQWQDISSPASNTVSMLFTDEVLNNAFNVVLVGGGNYTVTVTGEASDTTSTCIINGSTVNFGTNFSIASGTQCNITFTSGSGKTTSYGYSTFRVDITSTNTILSCKCARHSGDAGTSVNSLYWCVVNADITDTGNMFYTSSVYSTSLECCTIISSSLTSLGSRMFQNCYSLQSVTIPNSVTSIASYAFYTCYSLQSVTIPNSVTSIANDVFNACFSLQSATLPSGVTSLANGLFVSCASLKSVVVPNGITSIGSSVFGTCSSLQSVSLPSSVTSIGTGLFNNAYSLSSIGNLENITASNVDFDGTRTYNISSFNAPNISFIRLQLQGASGMVGKLHSLTFSPSSTFSSGTAPQLDISYTSFSDSELNAVFTALPTVTSKTIKITGCVGAATCDTSIATTKGWTVTA